MTDLGAVLIVILTAIYWLKKNKDLIVWQRKLEAYEKITEALYCCKRICEKDLDKIEEGMGESYCPTEDEQKKKWSGL